ncbi:MAG: response regulator [Planctomycetota bacterium]
MNPPTVSPTLSTVHIIDDDSNDIRILHRLCESVGLKVLCFESPREFLNNFDPAQTGCVVTDLLMPEMTGLQLYTELRRQGSNIPIIVLTGHADAGTCRLALHDGVFDYVEKSINPHDLLVVIGDAIAHDNRQSEERSVQQSVQLRLKALSPREQEVAQVLARGWSLKEIGSHFNISVQTASKHRAKLFDKLNVGNEVELFKLLLRVDPSHAT